MAKTEITPLKSELFGECIKISNGLVDIVAALEFGPRIVHFSLAGKENIFYNDTQNRTLGEKFKVFDGEHLILRGGHRIWTSPEVLPRCYHPDNKPVTYEINGDEVTLCGTVEEKNQIQKIFILTLDSERPSVGVKHIIKNTGLWDIEFAPWCITMMAEGGKSIIPQPNSLTGALPNRYLTLWDYSEMNDPRVHWGKEFITLTQDTKKENPFKLGLNNEHGWAAYFGKSQLFIKFFEPADVLHGNYPDNGCTYESYTNDFMLEMETLGEFALVGPDEEIIIDEEWEIHDVPATPSDDETEIKAALSKYIDF
ncbi:hypothetical protein AGMMS49975_07150 [Clostridia bacterium]|nr:hypothetical protein AGMMS49975_07150 [Clostridia bacterium]